MKVKINDKQCETQQSHIFLSGHLKYILYILLWYNNTSQIVLLKNTDCEHIWKINILITAAMIIVFLSLLHQIVSFWWSFSLAKLENPVIKDLKEFVGLLLIYISQYLHRCVLS